jgi:hypothetical protein
MNTRNAEELLRAASRKSNQLRTTRAYGSIVGYLLLALVLLFWWRAPFARATITSQKESDAGLLQLKSLRVAASVTPSSVAIPTPVVGTPSYGPSSGSWNCSTASALLQQSCSTVASAVSANLNNPFAAVIAVGGVSAFCPCATLLDCVQSRCGSSSSAPATLLVVNGVNMTQAAALTNILCDMNTTSCG